MRRPARGRGGPARLACPSLRGRVPFRPDDHCRRDAGGDRRTERWSAERLWICSGDELNLLFAEQFGNCSLVRCKLQMMRSEPCEPRTRIGPMLAAGLTLRHYASFQNCPSLPALCRRVADESPWFDRLGIHVMVSQNGRGELTIGDSHEYGDSIEPFDKAEVDDWILGYLRRSSMHHFADRLALAWIVCQALN